MEPRRHPRQAFALDRLLDALFAFVRDDVEREGGGLPLAVLGRSGGDEPFEEWPVSDATELRYLLDLGHELLLPITATLRGAMTISKP